MGKGSHQYHPSSGRGGYRAKGSSKGGGSHRAYNKGEHKGGGSDRAPVPTRLRSGKKRGRRSAISTRCRTSKARAKDSLLTARQAADSKHRLRQRQLADLGLESEESETQLSDDEPEEEATAEEPASASASSRQVYFAPSPSPAPRGEPLESFRSLRAKQILRRQHGATASADDAGYAGDEARDRKRAHREKH
jgi:hypothetical protein